MNSAANMLNEPGGLQVNWQDVVVTDNISPPSVSDVASSKTMPIDYQNLGPIYSVEDLASNKHKLDMTDVPNAILQMAYNKIHVPLSMITSSSLTKIRNNDNLKYRKIPFGNGVGKMSLDETSFPPESSLTETSFFQAYRNWLTIIDMISTPKVAVGWYEHHSRMLRDERFSSSFKAWHDMDRQLCTQFMNCPFTVDPDSSTYIHLLEHARMDLFLACCAKSQHTFESHQSFWTYPPYRSPNNHPHIQPGGIPTLRYTPYDKPQHGDSFREGKKPTLCLHCGLLGH